WTLPPETVYNLFLYSVSLTVFAKAPVAGRVKTRLCPPLSFYEAARLHRALTADLLDRLSRFPDIDLELATDTSTDAWSEQCVTSRLQVSGDLGTRMLASLQHSLQRGHAQAVILGSDAPTLPHSHIEALLASPADVALGPAEDGGYWGIAARRVTPDMFRGVRWSAPDTLAGTVAACRAGGLSVAFAPEWFDLDSAESLRRLRREDLPPRTGVVLDEILRGGRLP
ncbi:MAG: TIGR04282 family arsenosugar biosynthesis glycosyltransferase, partial [Bryobacteraceae bacterium]|nr:TIGR04282 family arsenosugar biosynthesis glycosyltransferase [Bryobacteraceae bacterium]